MAARNISEDDVTTIARLYGVPPSLALSIWEQESSKNRTGKGKDGKPLVSSAGARGPMQVMPGTFKEMMSEGGDIDNPVDNLVAGVKYLAKGLQRSGGDPEGAAQFYYGRLLKPGEEGRTSGPGTPTNRGYGKQVVARMGSEFSNTGSPAEPNTQLALYTPSGEPGIATDLYGNNDYAPDGMPQMDEEDDSDEDDTGTPADTDSPLSRLALYGGGQQDDSQNMGFLDQMGSQQDHELDRYVRRLVDDEFANG